MSRAVYCIRHGELTFNAAFRETGIDPLHCDAPLTDEGVRQVREAREGLRGIAFDLVVTSPLTRALQTTWGLFSDHPAKPVLLVEALHREHAESSCDVGRAPALLAAEFPDLRLDHLPEIWWHNEGEPDERGVCPEPAELLQSRVAEFRIWLQARPERIIAVVGHGTFFYHLTGQWLTNCEVMRLDLASRFSTARAGRPDLAWALDRNSDPLPVKAVLSYSARRAEIGSMSSSLRERPELRIRAPDERAVSMPAAQAGEAAPATGSGSETLRAILFILLAVFFFACSDAVSKVLMDTVSAVQVTWLRWVVFAGVMVPAAIVRGPVAVRSARPGLQALRGLGAAVSALLFIVALGSLPLAETTAVAFVAPLFVTALSVPFLGEKVGVRRWAAVVVGLLGVLIIVRPGTDAFDPAALLAILAALIWASTLIITRKMSAADDPLVPLTYTGVIGLVLLSAVVPFEWVDLGWGEVLLGALTGLTSTIAHWLIVLAHRNASASLLAPFFYSQLVWSTGLGLLVFQHVPDSWTFAGTGVIIASGIYTAHRERRRAGEHAGENVRAAPARQIG